jgi:hypothetical protein
MTTDTPDDAVPAEAVRELIAEWRERSERQKTPEEWATFGRCADELEALLADVEGERDE